MGANVLQKVKIGIFINARRRGEIAEMQ